MPRQLVRFAAIGVASTLAYLLLFLLFRGAWARIAANVVALLVTAVANTAANRRLTFGVRGREGAGRHQLQGLLVFGLGLAPHHAVRWRCSGTACPTPSRAVELAVLVLANLAATVLRFVLFRAWVFRPRTAAASSALITPGNTA